MADRNRPDLPADPFGGVTEPKTLEELAAFNAIEQPPPPPEYYPGGQLQPNAVFAGTTPPTTTEELAAFNALPPVPRKPFSRDGRDFYADPDGKLHTVDAGFDAAGTYPGWQPATAEQVAARDKQKATFGDALQGVESAALAAGANIGSGLSKLLVNPAAVVNPFQRNPTTGEIEERPLSPFAIEGKDIAAPLFTPEEKAQRARNPKAAFLGSIAPDVMGLSLLPGPAKDAALEDIARNFVGRNVAAGVTAEASTATIEDRPVTVGGIMQGGIAAGMFEKATHHILNEGIRAWTKLRTPLEEAPSAVDNAVADAQRAAVADLGQETDQVALLQKRIDHGEPAIAEYQAELDRSLDVIDTRLAAAPDKLFTPRRLESTVSQNVAAQADEVSRLATAFAQVADYADHEASREASQILANAIDGSPGELYGAMREARAVLSAADETPLPSAIFDEARAQLDDSLGNQSLWGTAAKNHTEFAPFGAAGESPIFEIDNLGQRETLDQRLELARRAASATGDKQLASAVKAAREALNKTDAVLGAQLLAEGGKPLSLLDRLKNAALEKAEEKTHEVLRGAAAGAGAAVGSAVAGPAGAAAGAMAGRKAYDALGKRYTTRIWQWARDAVKRNPTKVIGAGLLGASALDKDNEHGGMAAANVGLLAFFLPSGGRAQLARELGEALSGLTNRERRAIRDATDATSHDMGALLYQYAQGNTVNAAGVRTVEHPDLGRLPIASASDLLDAQFTLATNQYAREHGIQSPDPGLHDGTAVPEHIRDAIQADLMARNAALIENDPFLERLAVPGLLQPVRRGAGAPTYEERSATIERAEQALQPGDLAGIRLRDALQMYVHDAADGIRYESDVASSVDDAFGRWTEDFVRQAGRRPNEREVVYARELMLRRAERVLGEHAATRAEDRRERMHAVEGTPTRRPEGPRKTPDQIQREISESLRTGEHADQDPRDVVNDAVRTFALEVQAHTGELPSMDRNVQAETAFQRELQRSRLRTVEGGGQTREGGAAQLTPLEGGETELDRLGLPRPARTEITERTTARGEPGFIPEGMGEQRPVTVPQLEIEGPPMRELVRGRTSMSDLLERARVRLNAASDALEAPNADMPPMAYNKAIAQSNSVTRGIVDDQISIDEIRRRIDEAADDWATDFENVWGRPPSEAQREYVHAMMDDEALNRLDDFDRRATAARRAERERVEPNPEIDRLVAARQRRREVDAEANRLRAERAAEQRQTREPSPLELRSPSFTEEEPATIHGLGTGLARRLDERLETSLSDLARKLEEADEKQLAFAQSQGWEELSETARRFAADHPSITADEAERFARARWEETLEAQRENLDDELEAAIGEVAQNGDEPTPDNILAQLENHVELTRARRDAALARLDSGAIDIDSIAERASVDEDEIVGRAARAAHDQGYSGDDFDIDSIIDNVNHDGDGALTQAEEDFLRDRYSNSQTFERAHEEGVDLRRSEFDESEVSAAAEEGARELGENDEDLNWNRLMEAAESNLGRNLTSDEYDWLHNEYHGSSTYENLHQEGVDSRQADLSSAEHGVPGLPESDELKAAGLDVIAGKRGTDGIRHVFGQDLSLEEVRRLFALDELKKYAAETGANFETKLTVSGNEVNFSVDGTGMDIDSTYSRGRDGGLHLYQGRLFLPEDQQGLGLARKFIRSVFQSLEKLGATEIKCSAADIGKYVWPSLGFRPSAQAEAAAKEAFSKFLGRLPGGAIEAMGGVPGAMSKIDTLKDIADFNVPLKSVQPHFEELKRALVGERHDLPENLMFHLIKGPDFKAGKAFLLAQPGPWNYDLKLKIDRADPWYRDFLRRVGLTSVAGLGLGELMRAFSAQSFDVDDGSEAPPRVQSAMDARSEAAAAERRQDAETRGKLRYLETQSQQRTRTTAQALTGSAQSARVVPLVPGVTGSQGVAAFAGSSNSLRAAFEEKRDMLQRIAQNPMSLVAEMSDQLADMQGAAPDLHRQVVGKTYEILRFLQSKMPGTIGATLTRPAGTPPSEFALRQFALYYSAATNPSTALDDLANNRARKEQIDTLQQIWPEDVYNPLKAQVITALGDNKPTFNQRARLDVLFDFGGTLDAAFSPRIAAIAQANAEPQKPEGAKMPDRRTQPSVVGTSALSPLYKGAAGPPLVA